MIYSKGGIPDTFLANDLHRGECDFLKHMHGNGETLQTVFKADATVSLGLRSWDYFLNDLVFAERSPASSNMI